MKLQEFAREVVYGSPGDDRQLLPFDTPVIAIGPDGTHFDIDAVVVVDGEMRLHLVRV